MIERHSSGISISLPPSPRLRRQSKKSVTPLRPLTHLKITCDIPRRRRTVPTPKKGREPYVTPIYRNRQSEAKGHPVKVKGGGRTQMIGRTSVGTSYQKPHDASRHYSLLILRRFVRRNRYLYHSCRHSRKNSPERPTNTSCVPNVPRP